MNKELQNVKNNQSKQNFKNFITKIMGNEEND